MTRKIARRDLSREDPRAQVGPESSYTERERELAPRFAGPNDRGRLFRLNAFSGRRLESGTKTGIVTQSIEVGILPSPRAVLGIQRYRTTQVFDRLRDVVPLHDRHGHHVVCEVVAWILGQRALEMPECRPLVA